MPAETVFGREREALEREIFRYLGLRGTEPEPAVRRAAQECLTELTGQLTPREVHRFFPLEREGEDTFRIEGVAFPSRSLARNLAGCREVCLMAATVGMAPDRLSARASAGGKVSRAVIVQAAGAALIEAWCDQVNETIRKEAAERGGFLRPRFSPGYGDLALSHQTELFRLLNVQKTIGVTLTESLLMMPSKSVTALIGVSAEDARCTPQGCEACGRAEGCAYHR